MLQWFATERLWVNQSIKTAILVISKVSMNLSNDSTMFILDMLLALGD